MLGSSEIKNAAKLFLMIKKKIKYIMDEVLMDFKWEKRYTLDFQLGWFQVFFVFYLRQFGHYIGQLIILDYYMGIPVTIFQPKLLKIQV